MSTPVVAESPRVAAVRKHLAANLTTAYVVPGLLFYVLLRSGGVWAALTSALVWCYGAIAWRIITKRAASGLLWLTTAGLTGKTVLSFASGSTLISFSSRRSTTASSPCCSCCH